MFLGLDRAPRTVRSANDDVAALIRPTVSEGALHITIVTATWRGHTLPRWLLASAEAVANDALADANLALDVEQIVLGEGSLHILLNSR